MTLTLSERSAITVAVESWLSGELMAFHTTKLSQPSKKPIKWDLVVFYSRDVILHLLFSRDFKMAVMYLYLCQIHVDMKRSLPKCNNCTCIISIDTILTSNYMYLHMYVHVYASHVNAI